MTLIPTRLAQYPAWCPKRKRTIRPGEVIAEVKIGTTFSSGCFDCHWDDMEPLELGGDAS